MEKFSRSAFTLEESPDSQSNYQNWSNCVRTHTHTNGDQYTGEWQDGKYHGQGTFTWISGAQYVGEWKEHKRQGQGVYIEPDGEISTGIWVNRTCVKTLSFQSLQKTLH